VPSGPPDVDGLARKTPRHAVAGATQGDWRPALWVMSSPTVTGAALWAGCCDLPANIIPKKRMF